MAFITAETRSDLIELSVAMLKQAPSAALLEELIALSVGGGSLADAADHIAKTDAFKAEYPSFQTAEQYAAEIFDNITTGGTVTADIRTAVIELATGMLTSGSVTKAGLALAIAEYLAAPAALLNTDFADIAQSFQNRADAAEYFVVTKELGGSTAAELAAAIASVTSDAATLTAANTAADATASAEAVVAGQTFTLTTGLDTVTGGGGNDTISAVDSDAIAGVGPTTTINSGDSINAGAGTDRLSIVASGANATSAELSSSTIEEVAVYNNTGATYTVDTTLMSGLTDLYVVAGTGAVVFDDVNSSPNVHLTAVSKAVTVTHATSVGSGDADAVTIALNGASATLSSTLTYNNIETFNVVTSGAATGNALLPALAGRAQSLVSNQLETVNVSGSAAANLNVNMDGADLIGQVGTLDASEMTGNLVATVAAGGSGVLSVTGGAGNDTLNVNGGAINDDLTIDGGAGVDTLAVTSAAYDEDSTTGQAGDGVTNMEVLALNGTVAAASADVRAFSNNTFAALVSVGAATFAGLGTGAVSLTATLGGNQTLDRATDGATDVATVSLAGAAAQAITTVNVADEETVTLNSSATAAGINTITTLTATDLTSLTIAGNRGLTIGSVAGTKLATLDASGLSGTGSELTVSAALSTADMTVTGGAGVAALAADVMNDITTGSGDDTITTGDYNDTIDAGNGDNTVVAGDGDNDITTGRGDDTITAGDGDNIIVSDIGDDTITVGDGDNDIEAGNGDDTVTAGGTTTSTLVYDTNDVELGAGDDTYTGGAGRDIVDLGTGDDTVDTGAGTDFIRMSDYDDDDVVNGGAGTDTLSVGAIVASSAAAPLQIQAVGNFIDVTPGTSGTSTPQFTGVETVYMQAILATDNVEGAANVLTHESIDFSSTSGISNLYLEIDDDDVAGGGALDNQGVLTLSEVDAAAIHLVDRGTDDNLGELVVVGAGQASLTVKGYDFDGSTDLTVSDVDALTITAYQTSATVTVGDTTFGDVEADDAETVTVTAASQAAALAGQILTLASLSADGATAINLNAGSNITLAITGDVTSTSESLDTMAIVVSDDGTLTAGEIRTTASEMTSATITLGIASTLTITGEIDLESVEDVTITVGAASTLTADDLVMGGDVVINATMGSNIGVDTFGAAAITGTFDINGRGNLGAQTLSLSGVAVTKTLAMEGTTTLNIAGYTDTTGGTITIDALTATKATFVGNNQPTIITTGTGADSVTTGTGADVITGGAGADTITTGTGADDITIGATDSLNTALDKITDYTAGTDDLDLVTVPTTLVAAAAAGTAGADLVAAANYVSSGATAATLATDIAAIVALQGADAFDDVGDTIVVKLTGASVAGTGVTYVIQNQANDATYDAAADTVIALTGTSTAPTVLADFI